MLAHTILAPPSKSLSHRMLIGTALAKGRSAVHRVLMSKDIERTCAVLNLVGANIHPLRSLHSLHSFDSESLNVEGIAGKALGTALHSTDLALACDMHESGTSCRLLTAILAAGEGRFRIHGAPRLHQRPMGMLVQALQSLGVDISYEKRDKCPPLHMTTQGFQHDQVRIQLDESSQYISVLLLAAPCSAKGLTMYLDGEKSLSWPYVALTLQTLEDFGIQFHVQERMEENGCTAWKTVNWRTLQDIIPQNIRFCVPSGEYAAGNYTVEGDWSGASYFLAAGAVGTKPLRIQGLRQHSLQGDKAMLTILRRMGANIVLEGDDICMEPSSLQGIDVDMGTCPDIAPTVAITAAFAHGSTTIYNVPHLRIKESDRIAASVHILRQAGISAEEHDDGLTVHGIGKAPTIGQEVIFLSHNDHRIAMSAALFGLHAHKNICTDDPKVVEKSFPHFWQLWEELL